jgi:hypothetical protein
MAGTKAERHAIDAAALILAEEESRLGITHCTPIGDAPTVTASAGPVDVSVAFALS